MDPGTNRRLHPLPDALARPALAPISESSPSRGRLRLDDDVLLLILPLLDLPELISFSQACSRLRYLSQTSACVQQCTKRFRNLAIASLQSNGWRISTWDAIEERIIMTQWFLHHWRTMRDNCLWCPDFRGSPGPAIDEIVLCANMQDRPWEELSSCFDPGRVDYIARYASICKKMMTKVESARGWYKDELCPISLETIIYLFQALRYEYMQPIKPRNPIVRKIEAFTPSKFASISGSFLKDGPAPKYQYYWIMAPPPPASQNTVRVFSLKKDWRGENGEYHPPRSYRTRVVLDEDLKQKLDINDRLGLVTRGVRGTIGRQVFGVECTCSNPLTLNTKCKFCRWQEQSHERSTGRKHGK